MAEHMIQEQIAAINQKLDLIIENVELQKRKRKEMDDLFEDLNIVAKDVFHQSVVLLDKAQVELDSCGISCLLIKSLQNLGTFYEMLEMMESARDFMKDVSPVLHQVGLDAVHKLNELEKKGYFDYIREMGKFIDKWIRTFTVDDLKKMEDNLENLTGIIRNLTDPELLAALNRTSKVLAEVKMDDNTDTKSLWQIFRQLRSPEVRKSISYTLRLVQAINKS
jgi:uncharacterized protein YjgD (DUF1641 family)